MTTALEKMTCSPN